MLKTSEKNELKKAAKAVDLGVDIKKLEREIASLESKKNSTINEVEEIKNTVNKSILEDRKKIAKEREEFDSEIAGKKTELIELEKKISKQGNQVSKKEGEVSSLEDEIANHNNLVLEFQSEKKGVEKVRVSSLEKEHKADLIVEQFEKKIKDFSKKEEDQKETGKELDKREGEIQGREEALKK